MDSGNDLFCFAVSFNAFNVHGLAASCLSMYRLEFGFDDFAVFFLKFFVSIVFNICVLIVIRSVAIVW